MVKKRPPVPAEAVESFINGADEPKPLVAQSVAAPTPAKKASSPVRKKPWTITIRFPDETVLNDLKKLAARLERSQNDAAVRALKRGLEEMINN